MSDWIQTDSCQWQRKIGDTYEMYQVVWQDVVKYPYFAGGGTFKLADYDEDDIDWDVREYGYDGVEGVKKECGEDWEGIVAECVFECQFADFDLESFDTADEAIRFVNDLMHLLDDAPLDDEGFTLVDRWYCKVTDTFYPVGTTRREIDQDLANMYEED